MAGLLSLASALGTSSVRTKSQAYIAEIGDYGDIYLGTTLRSRDLCLPPYRFQYYPETIADSKQVNYQRRDIPGGALPIYQWINSGERAISFTAVFASDVNMAPSRDGSAQDTDAVAIRERLNSVAHQDRNVDIRSALTWLRRLTLPIYENIGNGFSVQAPKRIMLFMPGTGIGVLGGYSDQFKERDAIACILTQCDISLEALFHNGVPRLASAQLTFVQIAQGTAKVQFPNAYNMDLDVQGSDIGAASFGGLSAFPGGT